MSSNFPTPPIAQYSYDVYGASHLSANGTTTIRSGEGLLGMVTINTKGASANTCTIYDNTAGSGTVLAVIDTTVTPQSLFYGVKYTVGLTVVVATGTAADITISYL